MVLRYPTASGRAAIRPQRTGYAVSHDGIVWEKSALRLFEFDGDGGANNICVENIGSVVIWGGRRYDTGAFVRDEQDPDDSRRFKLVWQELTASAKSGGPPRVRNKHLAFGRTELTWRPSRRNPIIDPNRGNEQEIHFLAYVPYRGQYLLLYEFGWYHPDGTGRYGRYAADIRIAHSRDGERFTRIRSDQQLIAGGAHGEWDDQFPVICDKIVVKDGTIFFTTRGRIGPGPHGRRRMRRTAGACVPARHGTRRPGWRRCRWTASRPSRPRTARRPATRSRCRWCCRRNPAGCLRTSRRCSHAGAGAASTSWTR